jgi:type IV pilus assembly protein PilX
MNARIPRNRRRRSQRGAVLFLAMIFLLLLTILAVTASSTSIMQERMTGGMRNLQLGLMGAESGLRGGEQFLWALSFDDSQPLPPCLPGDSNRNCVFKPKVDGTLLPEVQRFRTSREWLDPATDRARPYGTNLTSLGGSAVSANLATQPRFIVEHLGTALPPFRQGMAKDGQGKESRAGEHFLYRITTRSQGGTDGVVRITESVYSANNLTNTGYNPE